MSQNILGYAPSKGFTSYPQFGCKIKLPRELGFPTNMLANPQGISEPEGYRTIIGYFSDGTPIEEADPLLSRKVWNGIVRGLQALHSTTSVIKTENKLGRNAHKAAKHRVKTLVALRAKRLMKLDSSLDPLEAMSLAEAQFGNLVVETEGKGKPSYQYATPRYDSHNLKYVLQDNTKSRVIVKLSGQDARDYVKAL